MVPLRQYPVFEVAITGRVTLADNPDTQESGSFKRGSSMIDLSKQTDEERDAIRNAVVQKEGVLISVFDVLRRLPRRVLMVLKLNDLTRWVFKVVHSEHSPMIV